MHWRNAKSLTLIFLIVLNIFLGVLLYANTEDYKLTTDAENAILKLLSENNIKLQYSIPKEYKPLSQLIMTPGVYDTDAFQKIFFSDTQNTKITLEYDKTIYKANNETLVFQNGGVSYTSGDTDTSIVLNEDSAVMLCEAFFANSDGYLMDFALDRCVATADGFVAEYRQRYKSSLIFSNYLVFNITEKGIVHVRGRFDKATSFDDKPKEIISPDRALFVFIKHINNEYEGMEVLINGIDVAYIQNETSVNAGASLKASPYYRIYYSASDRPFLINAYTGDIFDYYY